MYMGGDIDGFHSALRRTQRLKRLTLTRRALQRWQPFLDSCDTVEAISPSVRSLASHHPHPLLKLFNSWGMANASSIRGAASDPTL